MKVSSDIVREVILNLMNDKSINYKSIAIALETSPQNVHKRLHKSKLTLEDVKEFADVLGVDVEINLVDRSSSKKVRDVGYDNKLVVLAACKVLSDMQQYEKDLTTFIECLRDKEGGC